MPALVLFGRRWRTASDDFFFSGLFNACFSATWLVVFYSEWRKVSQDHSDNSLFIRVVTSAFVITLSLSLIADLVITWMSTLGTIMNPHPRRHMNFALYSRVVTSFAEACLTASLMVLAFQQSSASRPFVSVWITRVAAIVFAIVLTGKAIGCLLAYDTLGKQANSHVSLDDEHAFEETFRLWRRRFKMLTCCCCIRKSEVRDAFEDVSKVLASIFKDLDLVTSDIIAGFLLLYGRIDMKSKETLCSSRVNVPGWMNVTSAAHYFKYAFGCYGWPFFVLSNPCCWLCQLAPFLRCCKTTGSNQIAGDLCNCELASLKVMTDSDDADMIHISFENRVYEVPFFVAVDHKTQAIVLSIRGSMTVRDILTDLDADCQSLNYPGVPEEFSAHRGIAKAAEKLYQKLCESKALDEALTFHREYSLIIVGHSLGAGVAALIGIRLHSTYPNMRCYLYGPPGGFLSIEAAQYTETFQMSVIFGYDFISRLNLFNVGKLKESVIRVLQHCSKPKFQVLAQGCWKVCLTKTKNLKESGSFYNQIQQDTNVENSAIPACFPYTKMHLPGRILHIFRNTDKSDARKFLMCWKEVKDFDEILLTPKMLSDHVPMSMSKALEACANSEQIITGTQ